MNFLIHLEKNYELIEGKRELNKNIEKKGIESPLKNIRISC